MVRPMDLAARLWRVAASEKRQMPMTCSRALSYLGQLRCFRPRRPAAVAHWSRSVRRKETRAMTRSPGTACAKASATRPARGALVQWSPDTLRQILERSFPTREVIVVSNREPYVHELVDGEVLSAGAGKRPGLGPGAGDPHLLPAPGSPMAAARPTARRSTPATMSPCRRTIRPIRSAAIWLTEEEYKGYYYGFANEGLWPLCHIAFTRPDLPGRRLGMLPGGQPQVRRRRSSRRPRASGPSC